MDGPVSNLPCVNCKQPIEGEMHFFAKVLVCDSCYKLANHLKDRGRKELRLLTLLLEESIRVAIIQGELHLSAPPQDESSRESFFSEISRLIQDVRMKGLGKNTWMDHTTTRSRGPMKQSASTVDGPSQD